MAFSTWKSHLPPQVPCIGADTCKIFDSAQMTRHTFCRRCSWNSHPNLILTCWFSCRKPFFDKTFRFRARGCWSCENREKTTMSKLPIQKWFFFFHLKHSNRGRWSIFSIREAWVRTLSWWKTCILHVFLHVFEVFRWLLRPMSSDFYAMNSSEFVSSMRVE